MKTIPYFYRTDLIRVSMSLATLCVAFSVCIAPCEAFEFLFPYNKWAPGLNSIETHSGDKDFPTMTPGGASWSAMASGIEMANIVKGFESHPLNAVTTDIEFLITPAADGLEYAIFNDAFNTWAAVANITNLGQVADSGAKIGDSEANGGQIGDIRVAGIPFTIAGDLAHGFQPCTISGCSADGTIGGDIHFNSDDTWVDDPNEAVGGVYDFFTDALHEIGHALGLNHSDVPGSVMWPVYEGARRTLTADDIAGIQSLYGPSLAVPEPSSLVLVLFGLSSLFSRRQFTR